MTSKREEERNEKIIRGLMKLPPNRRCINCNGLGPQYVCTNFWTFICMACSGIHREFTHRVKSVSMSKFSSQEVEALEKGGNQRARETYLRDWDPQIQRLPDSSNAERVREFIKSVYVDRRYATGKPSDKPPRDAQNFRNREDETRRASSYHSYSQSPPYDNQYEDRLYGRHVHTLRRPGSDRSLYEGKVSCFSSPSRLSDQQSEDRFANEEPNHRVSDYSLSVSGDPFKTHPLSPNFERNIGSPSSQTSGDTFSEDSRHHRVSSLTETNPKMDPNGLLRPQRTASLGSFGSFDSKSMPFKSVSSIDLFNDASIHEQPAGIHKSSDVHDVTSLTEPSTNRNLNGLGLFHSTVVTQNISSNTMVDLFQLPGAPKAPHADLFQLPGVPKAPHADLFQLPDAPKAPHADLFQPPSSSVREVGVNQTSKSKSSSDTFSGKVASFPDRISLDDESVVKNEGWATFDIPHHLSDPGIKDAAQGVSTSVAGNHVGKMDQHLPPNTNLQWPAFGDASIHGSSLVSNLWPEDLNSFLPTEPWSAAFTPSTEHFPPGTILPGGNHDDVPPDVRHYMGDFSVNEILRGPSNGAYVHSSLPIDAGGPQSHGIDRRSTNPFDLPYDTDLESSDMFLDMNSLQSALPSEPILSNAYIDVMGGQPWFSQNSVVPQDPSQGSLVFIGGEVSSTQLQNISAQGPVASVGGNPFA